MAVDPARAGQPMLIDGINQFFYSDFSDFSYLETLANSNKSIGFILYLIQQDNSIIQALERKMINESRNKPYPLLVYCLMDYK